MIAIFKEYLFYKSNSVGNLVQPLYIRKHQRTSLQTVPNYKKPKISAGNFIKSWCTVGWWVNFVSSQIICISRKSIPLCLSFSVVNAIWHDNLENSGNLWNVPVRKCQQQILYKIVIWRNSLKIDAEEKILNKWTRAVLFHIA